MGRWVREHVHGGKGKGERADGRGSCGRVTGKEDIIKDAKD